MKAEDILLFIEACRERGVMQFKGDLHGHVEFSLFPSFQAVNADPFDALRKPIDATKCSTCQVAPPEQRYSGQCRGCYLRSAGVSTS